MARERRKKDIAPMGLLNTVYREKSNKEPSERARALGEGLAKLPRRFSFPPGFFFYQDLRNENEDAK